MKPLKILIVKLSSLGDVLQTFGVVDYLLSKNCEITWAVDSSFAPLLAAHSGIKKVIPFDFRGWKKNKFASHKFASLIKSFNQLKEEQYDVVFDLQGNIKSACITFWAKGKEKVGFGKKSVKEWPNLLVTQQKHDPPANLNMQLQYLKVVQSNFKDEELFLPKTVILKLQESETKELKKLLKQFEKWQGLRLIVAPHAAWPSKCLEFSFLESFLKEVEKRYHPFFLFVSGSEKEKAFNEKLHELFLSSSAILHLPSLPLLQNIMLFFSGVVAMDSAILHMAATANTPTFSFFGPTKENVYRPLGERHFSIQVACPYNSKFVKVCRELRSCKTPCLQNVDTQKILLLFSKWIDVL